MATRVSKNSSAAKALLRDENTPAFACMRAVDTLLGEFWLAWEPETLWLELSHNNVAVSVSNRNKIMAGRSIVTTGRFYYDAVAFEKTAIAFNDDEPNFEMMDDAPVEYLAWTNEEAYKIHLFYRESNFEYDREPVEYTAVQLRRAGLVVAPAQLHWAQASLDKQWDNGAVAVALKRTVMDAWASKVHTLDETPVGVQLARLSAVKAHVDARTKELEGALAKLG